MSSSAGEEVVLRATVCEPVRQGDGIKAYMLYKIRSAVQGSSGEAEVNRRYSDFVWLHDALQYGFPGVVVPPLPEKRLRGTFEPAFLQTRTRFLQKFLDRCLEHPELSRARVVLRFLTTADPSEFQEVKSAEKLSQGHLLDWLAQTSARAYKSVAGLAGFAATSLPTTPDDEVFEDIKRYVALIEPHINNTTKFAERIVADRKDAASCHFDLGALQSCVVVGGGGWGMGCMHVHAGGAWASGRRRRGGSVVRHRCDVLSGR
jgi:sorting nexin-1/2